MVHPQRVVLRTPTFTPSIQQGCLIGRWLECGKLLFVFRERFGCELEFAQRTYQFAVRLFSGGASSVDRGVVAILGPDDGFGDIVIFAVALGPPCIKVQLHAPRPRLHHPLL
jgi:hypothetical protein